MIGFIVFTLIVGIVIYSRFYIVSNTLPNATAIRMSNLVSHYGFCEETLDISGVNIHYVSTVCDVSGCSDVIVFIHGTASCSVTFFDVMKELSRADPRGYACIAIDLPNFGISGNFEIETASTNRDLCEQYADIIGHTLYKLGILERATLVAHSLGGFLSIFVANRFPIKKLVLLNPAGILPTLGEYGYYWAIFFKAGLPTTAFHLPIVSNKIAATIWKKIFGDDRTEFWFYFLANPYNTGHQILQRLITLKLSYSYWNTPAISILTDAYKKVPTTVCFGINDTICPSHIGAFLYQMTRGEIMVHNIQNASHNPCDNTDDIVNFLYTLVGGKSNETNTPRLKLHQEHKTNKYIQKCKGYSYHSLTKTRESFERVYAYLLTHTTCYPPHSESPL
jgi:pimeloyl-ACP methyl ester carboxylesterase